jgi:hypothetical protein
MAVVRSTPDSRELASEQDLVAVLAQLMSSVNTGEGVLLEESLAHILSEDVSCTPGRDTESKFVSLRVAPHEVCKRALVRNFLHSENLVDILDLMKGGRETPVDSKDLSVDNGSNGEVVEHVSEELPNFWVSILGLTLSIEAIDLGDLSSLVVATDEGDPLWVAKL